MKSGQKNADPEVATQNRLDDQIRGRVIPKSVQNDCTMKKLDPQVSAFLQKGSKNAVSSKFLMNALGLSQRELRAVISRARDRGEIILSNSSGYFIPADGEEGRKEIIDCVRTLRAKGISTLRAAAGIQRPLRDLYGQEFIDEIETG